MKKLIYGCVLAVFAAIFIAGCGADETPEPETFTITYETDGNGYIEGESGQEIGKGGNGKNVTAKANTGYKFVGWSDGVKDPMRQETDVTENLTIKANFEKITYVLNYGTDGNGQLLGKSEQNVGFEGDAEIVLVVPLEGYEFLEWSDGVKMETRQDKNISCDISVTAKFIKKVYTVTYETDGNGYIDGESGQNVKFDENGTLVRAIPNEGYEFSEWSDGVKDASRQDKNIAGNVSVTAKFTKKTFKVKYAALGPAGGRIRGKMDQIVEWGETTETVVAVPQEGYIFIGWSDGVETAERFDEDLRQNLSVTAYFGYSVEYKVNNKFGGKIVGETYQAVKPQENYKEITAVPEKGYVFCGWDDLSMQSNRTDVADKCFEYTAYFEPVEKTFTYNYGDGYGTPTDTSITLNRNSLKDLNFVIPERSGYKFLGWYADGEYVTKVVNENGVYMLGYYGLTLETGTLYARWEKENATEEVPVYKVLFVFVDEVDAVLYSSKAETDIEVKYKMTALDRSLSALTAKQAHYYLNDCFEGRVKFEVDSYYTLDTVGSESFTCYMGRSRLIYCTYSKDIKETEPLNNLYHSVITTSGLSDYEHLISESSTIAMKKYGYTDMDEFLPVGGSLPRAKYFEEVKEGKRDYFYNSNNFNVIAASLLEALIYTCDMWNEYGEDDLTCFDILLIYVSNEISWERAIKEYLTGEALYDGKKYGISWEYWEHGKDVALDFTGDDNTPSLTT